MQKLFYTQNDPLILIPLFIKCNQGCNNHKVTISSGLALTFTGNTAAEDLHCHYDTKKLLFSRSKLLKNIKYVYFAVMNDNDLMSTQERKC